MTKKTLLTRTQIIQVVEDVKNGMTIKGVAKVLGVPPYHVYYGLKFYGFPESTESLRTGINTTDTCSCGASKDPRHSECINCYSIIVAGRPLLMEDVRVVNYDF